MKNPKVAITIGLIVVAIALVAVLGAPRIFVGGGETPTPPTEEIYFPVGESAPGATGNVGVESVAPQPTLPGEVEGCLNTMDPSVIHPLNETTPAGYTCTYDVQTNSCWWNTGMAAVCARR